MGRHLRMVQGVCVAGRPYDATRAPWLRATTILYICWSLFPLVIAITYSFNAAPSVSRWEGFSLRWWVGNPRDEESLLYDPELRRALVHTVSLAFWTTVIAVPMGTAFALGAARLALPRGARGNRFDARRTGSSADRSGGRSVPRVHRAVATRAVRRSGVVRHARSARRIGHRDASVRDHRRVRPAADARPPARRLRRGPRRAADTMSCGASSCRRSHRRSAQRSWSCLPARWVSSLSWTSCGERTTPERSDPRSSENRNHGRARSAPCSPSWAPSHARRSCSPFAPRCVDRLDRRRLSFLPPCCAGRRLSGLACADADRGAPASLGGVAP